MLTQRLESGENDSTSELRILKRIKCNEALRSNLIGCHLLTMKPAKLLVSKALLEDSFHRYQKIIDRINEDIEPSEYE